MKRGRLLFVLWCSSILAVTGSVRAVTCLSDYTRNISCVLVIPDSPRSNNYSLMFTGRESVSCPLVRMNHSYHCNCSVKDKTDTISVLDNYTISLCNESNCRVVEENFMPCLNIQLTPPDFELQHTNESLNITCKTERFKSDFLGGRLIYEFKLQESQGNERTLSSNSLQFISINTSVLKPNTEYCIKARYMPDEGSGYAGIWSKWSEPKCWINETEEDTSEQDSIFILLAKYLSPVCFSAVILLLVFYSPAARMKIKTITHTPSPAPFFQPLFHQHEGNLQEWLSPQGKFLLTYKAEVDLIANDVTVAPKPITKDPEETQSFISPPVTHLVFPPSLTSYVGLPGMHEASPPITIVCAEDIPYTQLPCPIWGFDMSEIQATSPPLEDFFEISKADSGCSCEDPSFSSECSSLSSPVDESPPPHFCNDYCILNKTAEGIVPVLLSKQSGGKILSDSQQEDESLNQTWSCQAEKDESTGDDD